MSKVVEELRLDFDDVLIKPKRSTSPSRSNIPLFRDVSFYHHMRQLHCLPIIVSNMDTTGTFKMLETASKRGMMVALHKYYRPSEIKAFLEESYVTGSWWFTMGITDEDFDRLDDFKTLIPNIPCICIDAANGYTEYFVSRVAKVRQSNPESIIMAGNVCTPEMVQELIIHGGADIIKIGIGPGSVCTTRLKTGCGYPQLSAILECGDIAHGLRNQKTGNVGRICSDGGCKTPGDIAKAFGAGADFVMIGGMVAGCDECDGEWIEKPVLKDPLPEEGDIYDQYTLEKHALKFYGMSSAVAQEKYGGIKTYRASEGKEVSIPYKGPADEVFQEIEGGLRSACTYTGATTLKDLSRTTTFVRVNNTHNRIFEL